MKVHELIAILQTCDPEMEVATHATNHTQIDRGSTRVVLMSTYDGPRVAIGDFSKRNVNGPNWFVIRPVDGGKPIPQEWSRYGRDADFFEQQDRYQEERLLQVLRERGHDAL